MTNSYFPHQIPYLLNETFHQYFDYKETVVEPLSPFVICLWSIQGKPGSEFKTMNNVILPDGCIDIIVSFSDHVCGFSGTSKTTFDFDDNTEKQYFGFRMLPGAFAQLTDKSASEAMDNFSDASEFFKLDTTFWNLKFDDAQTIFIDKLIDHFSNLKPSSFIELFLSINNNPHQSVEDIAQSMGYSIKQSHRLFMKHYGLSPKHILSVIRLQKALDILYRDPNTPLSHIASHVGYYDQSHFNNDLVQNLRLTPKQLLNLFHD